MEQLEWLTGGECAAGMHEVVVSENTIQAIDASQKAGKSLWRVSSTVSSCALDTLLYCFVPSLCSNASLKCLVQKARNL